MPSFLSDDFLILVLYGATEKGNSMMRGYFFVNVSTSVFHAFFFSYFNAPPRFWLTVKTLRDRKWLPQIHFTSCRGVKLFLTTDFCQKLFC